MGSLFKKSVSTYIQKAGFAVMRGNLDAALEFLNSGLREWPNDIELLDMKASVLSTKALFLVGAPPEGSEVLVQQNFGVLNENEQAAKLSREAFFLYDSVLEKEPKRANSYMCRASLRFGLGDKNGAIIDLERAEELGSDNRSIVRQMLREIKEIKEV